MTCETKGAEISGQMRVQEVLCKQFFGNEEIEWSDILAPHIESSLTRMAAHEVVLCMQDTNELDFNGQTASGLGPFSYEAQRGMYLFR